jgi:signal transduction histidine kinase
VLGLIGTFLILLFPDGHLPSRGWRWVGWFSGLAVAYVYLMITLIPGSLEEIGYPGVDNPLGVPVVGDLADLLLLTIVVIPISFVLCATAVVQRFRRSGGTERLQLKWLATAGATVAALYFVTMLGSLPTGFQDADAPWLLVLQQVSVLSFALIPLAIGVAILKHGLYEIDVVINRAVVYGALAVFITAVYVAIVVGVGRLVGGGDRPDLALSIVATAVVAVAFEPVRARVQRFANRLVYGVRATPYEVLSKFADRVGGSFDAGELLPTMARTVGEGIGATSTEVWLASGPGLVLETSWAASGVVPVAPRTVEDVSELRGSRVAEVRHGGELLGALTVNKPAGEELNPAEEKLLADVAGQAGLVLRNVRLIEDLRSSRQRLVSTADEERRRLERNLHDGAQQSLVAVALMITSARSSLAPEDASLGPALEQAADQLRAAIDELRELARGIHPAILTDRGLGPAISSLAERSPVPVVVDFQLEQRPPAAVEASLYFAAAEALTNVAKYAHATEVTVTVAATGTPGGGGGLVLEVADNGIGGADMSRGSGLRGLVDRLAVVGGTVAVHSLPGQGTRLTCAVPVLPTDEAPSGGPVPVPLLTRSSS